jgi:AraC family transcriptional regulator
MRSQPSRSVYRGDTFAIGEFRCAPRDPRFRDSGPAGGNLIVFPREPVVIRHAGRAAVIADSTTAMVYNERQQYTRAEVSPVGDRCEWFAFAATTVAEAYGHDDLARPFGELVRVPLDAATYLLARRAYDHARGRVIDPDWLDEVAMTLLDRVIASARATTPCTPRGTHLELAEAVRCTLALHHAEAHTLAQLAASHGVSAFHLARVFRAVTGHSLHRYRTELRLRAALERIADGVPLATLAFELGFSSHSHFTQAFRAVFATPPRTLRARS